MNRLAALLMLGLLLSGCGSSSPVNATQPISALTTQVVPTDSQVESVQVTATVESAEAVPTLIGPTPIPENSTVEMVSNEQIPLTEAQAQFTFRVPPLTIPGFEQDGRATLWVFDVKSGAGESLSTYHMAVVDWFKMSGVGEVTRMTLVANERYTHAYLLERSGEENIIVTSLGDFPAVIVDGQWEYNGQKQGERRMLTLVWFENGIQYMLTVPKGVVDGEELGQMLLPPTE